MCLRKFIDCEKLDMDKWLINNQKIEIYENKPQKLNLKPAILKRKHVMRIYYLEYLKIVITWNENYDDP